MIIRSKAPFRLEFSGGGTDVPPFPDDHGGLIFNATINNYAYCSVKNRQDDQFKVHSLDYNTIARYKNDNDLEFDGNLDLIKAVLKRMSKFNIFNDKGVDIVLHSDIPAGSGLGSSSTVCVALVGALAAYYRLTLNQSEVASLAYEIERTDLGIAGGLQDQYAAAYGGFNLMEFHKDLKVIVNPLKVRQDIKNELLYHLVLINTGQRRMSDGILRDQVGVLKNDPDKVLKHYFNLKDIAVEMKNSVITGDVEKFGRLLETAWLNKKQVSTKISNEQIELLYETAKNNGAIGGRILGAGGGGHMLFYVKDIVNRKPLISALVSLGASHVPFGFEDDGIQTWAVKE
jgi:D-glycero-alpha-D-manno-heptose-7-phosphate kinase